MTERRMTDEELTEEARRWDEREVTPNGWEDAPEAVPRAKESVPISIRLPRPLVGILKEFARREGVGYQVLMKRWLDERVRQEHKRLQDARRREELLARRKTTVRLVSPTIISTAATFDAGERIAVSKAVAGEAAASTQ
jgi:predicted DNA binding CopG/RHH family protein